VEGGDPRGVVDDVGCVGRHALAPCSSEVARVLVGAGKPGPAGDGPPILRTIAQAHGCGPKRIGGVRDLPPIPPTIAHVDVEGDRASLPWAILTGYL
jgi:hypothetical protein